MKFLIILICIITIAACVFIPTKGFVYFVAWLFATLLGTFIGILLGYWANK